MDEEYAIREPTAEEVSEYAARWGLEAGDGVKDWLYRLYNQTYFATAYLVPFVLAGVQGMMYAQSTAEGTRVFKAGMAANNRREVYADVDWYYYETYWYPGLALMNIAGLVSPEHTSMGYLGDVLARASGRGDFRSQYCMLTHGLYQDGLRRCLTDLGIAMWVEFTAGISWQGYRLLDLYVAYAGASLPRQEMEAWYLLNATEDPRSRHLYAPEDWYSLRAWISNGQRHSIRGIGLVNLIEGLRIVSARSEDPRAATRLGILTRQLNPGSSR